MPFEGGSHGHHFLWLLLESTRRSPIIWKAQLSLLQPGSRVQSPMAQSMLAINLLFFSGVCQFCLFLLSQIDRFVIFIGVSLEVADFPN
ncbi:hypothetical protein K7X08_009342 [Anisodus acutangulus]|uniref:Uncharacterized protein n=1 Tax=Anisodus acutangulus TaxID=402998 RepID=A0A9Q1N0P7_9SOLA|nr:hypothetical protein K7X08_009342 [Anisodus acutangulus]